MKKIATLLLLALLAVTAQVNAQALDQPAASANEPAPRLTGPTPMPKVVPAPPMASDSADDKRKKRNYPEQPPLIPHSIVGYQLDRNYNKCLSCHSRQYSEGSQAPMISVTHYQTRSGQMQAGVSARRYFCTQCHVPQSNAQPLVENTFMDMDKLTAKGQQGDKK